MGDPDGAAFGGGEGKRDIRRDRNVLGNVVAPVTSPWEEISLSLIFYFIFYGEEWFIIIKISTKSEPFIQCSTGEPLVVVLHPRRYLSSLYT